MLKITSNAKMESLKKEIAELELQLDATTDLDEKEDLIREMEKLEERLVDSIYNFLLDQIKDQGYINLSDNADDLWQVMDANAKYFSVLDKEEIFFNLTEKLLNLNDDEYVVFGDFNSIGGEYFRAVFKKVEGLKAFSEYEIYYNISLGFPNF